MPSPVGPGTAATAATVAGATTADPGGSGAGTDATAATVAGETIAVAASDGAGTDAIATTVTGSAVAAPPVMAAGAGTDAMAATVAGVTNAEARGDLAIREPSRPGSNRSSAATAVTVHDRSFSPRTAGAGTEATAATVATAAVASGGRWETSLANTWDRWSRRPGPSFGRRPRMTLVAGRNLTGPGTVATAATVAGATVASPTTTIVGAGTEATAATVATGTSASSGGGRTATRPPTTTER